MRPQPNLFILKPGIITMYSTSWRLDCKRAKDFFTKHQIQYEDLDVEESEEGLLFVKKLNNGMRIIPTIIFPDGDILVEPSNAQLTKKLNL